MAGMEPLKESLKWNRKFNSSTKICLGANGGHRKTCNKCINCTSNG